MSTVFLGGGRACLRLLWEVTMQLIHRRRRRLQIPAQGSALGFAEAKHRRTLKEFAGSVPKIILVVFNSVLLQKTSIFILEGNAPMVMLLVFDISIHAIEM